MLLTADALRLLHNYCTAASANAAAAAGRAPDAKLAEVYREDARAAAALAEDLRDAKNRIEPLDWSALAGIVRTEVVGDWLRERRLQTLTDDYRALATPASEKSLQTARPGPTGGGGDPE
jgi:hypothetical protein